MENNPKITIVAVIVVMVMVLGGMYYLNNRNPGITNIPRPGAPLPEGPNLQQNFEDFLNKFLKDVQAEMIDYRKERKVLTEAMQAENLRTPEYVEENYKLVNTLVPSLRQRMAGVIKIFEDAEVEVDNLLLNQPENVRKSILQKWESLKSTAGENYIEYFTFESDILNAYQVLMQYYYDHRAEFEADLQNGEVVFNNEATQNSAKELQDRIKLLTDEQAKALAKIAAEQEAAAAAADKQKKAE